MDFSGMKCYHSLPVFHGRNIESLFLLDRIDPFNC